MYSSENLIKTTCGAETLKKWELSKSHKSRFYLTFTTMPCRIEITTDPDARFSYWETQYHGIKNFKILKICRTKNEAQSWENHFAQQLGCEAHPGGADAHGPWYVYYFEYLRVK